jgi:hypothetical protein
VYVDGPQTLQMVAAVEFHDVGSHTRLRLQDGGSLHVSSDGTLEKTDADTSYSFRLVSNDALERVLRHPLFQRLA